MPVFISHRTQDDERARKIYLYLRYDQDIECYIDDFDEVAGIAQKTNRITDRILERLEYCTHLLALVTENTEGSWWVPFEIGVARRAPRVISTFTNLYGSDLPEYLREWPILRRDDELAAYAILYRRYKTHTNQLLQEDIRLPDRRAFADQAHSRLQTRLTELKASRASL